MLVEFPAFCHGTFSELQRRVLRVAKSWAKAYEALRSFPPVSATVDLWPVPAGAVIRTCVATDLQRNVPAWRSYFVSRLCSAICERLDGRDVRDVFLDFENHVVPFAWGALDAAIAQAVTRTRSRQAIRIRTLLLHWEALASFQYVGRAGLTPVSLEALVRHHYGGLLTMWSGAAGGDLQATLLSAVSRMEGATQAEMRDAIVIRLLDLAGHDDRLRPNRCLHDKEWLLTKLASTDEPLLEELAGGDDGKLLTALYDFDEASRNPNA